MESAPDCSASNEALGIAPCPADWRQHWDQPMSWPRGDLDHTDPHRRNRMWQAWQVDPAEAGLVLVDVDKQAYDMYIEDIAAFDVEIGRKLLRRVYDVAVPNTIRLVEFFRQQKRPIIFIQWDWHRRQYPPIEPIEGEPVVYKTATGAFGSSDIEDVLGRTDLKTLFFAGSDTAFCLESTVRGAKDHGYRAVIVEDACFSWIRQLHDCVLQTVGWHLSFVTTTDQVIETYPWDKLTGVPHPVWQKLTQEVAPR